MQVWVEMAIAAARLPGSEYLFPTKSRSSHIMVKVVDKLVQQAAKSIGVEGAGAVGSVIYLRYFLGGKRRRCEV
jgi:hypothetical protein